MNTYMCKCVSMEHQYTKLNLLLGQSHGQFWSYLELQRMLQLMKFLLDASCWQWFCFLLRQGLRLACSLSFSFPESPHCWDSNHGPPHLAFGNAPQTMFWSYTKAFTYLSEFALTHSLTCLSVHLGVYSPSDLCFLSWDQHGPKRYLSSFPF